MANWLKSLDREVQEESKQRQQKQDDRRRAETELARRKRNDEDQAVKETAEYQSVKLFVDRFDRTIEKRLADIGRKKAGILSMLTRKYRIYKEDRLLFSAGDEYLWNNNKYRYRFLWRLIAESTTDSYLYVFLLDEQCFMFVGADEVRYKAQIEEANESSVIDTIGNGYKYGPTYSTPRWRGG